MCSRPNIDEFVAQLADLDMDDVVKGYAERRARIVARLGGRVDDLYARELLQDVLQDTLEGRLYWDPKRKSLRQHVMDSMKWRSRHDYKRARHFRHYSIDEDGWMTAAESALSSRSGDETFDADECIDELRDLAADDEDVTMLLDAYRERITKKVDVLRATRLSHLRYDAARKRMQRLRDDLPHRTRRN